MNATIKAAGAALVLAASAVGAKAAHLGPFADQAIHAADTAVMSSLAFRENYAAMRAGTVVERHAVDIACGLFSSVGANDAPPAGWSSFRSALAERIGVTDSTKYIDGKVERLAVAVDLAEHNPRLAAEYARHCLL